MTNEEMLKGIKKFILENNDLIETENPRYFYNNVALQLYENSEMFQLEYKNIKITKFTTGSYNIEYTNHTLLPLNVDYFISSMYSVVFNNVKEILSFFDKSSVVELPKIEKIADDYTRGKAEILDILLNKREIHITN